MWRRTRLFKWPPRVLQTSRPQLVIGRGSGTSMRSQKPRGCWHKPRLMLALLVSASGEPYSASQPRQATFSRSLRRQVNDFNRREMRLVFAALSRPFTVVVALIALTLFAFVAVQRMPVDIFPKVGEPAIYVAQPYGGMDPAQMEGYLTYYY